MQELTKQIYDISSNRNIINSRHIYNFILKMIDSLKLNDYIYEILFCDIKGKSLTRYYINEKRLCIDFKKVVYYVSNYIANLKKDYSFENKILLTNLYIIKILYHELEHAIQEKKINYVSNDETKILTLSCDWEDKLKSNNIKLYEKEKYLYNPIERQANIMSNKRIIEICNILENQEIFNFFDRELIDLSLYGYSDKGSDYPIIKYFLGNSEFSTIKDLIKKDGIFNFDKRIDMGLEISENEYYSLEEKKKSKR